MYKTEDINNIMTNINEFVSNIIRKKYCLENESSYEDIINKRFLPYLKNNNIDAKDILINRRFIPGGSILRGFQNTAKVSMSNCYVLMPIEDSIEGIFDLARKMAKTFSYSGGVGYDISILRPKNCPVNNSAKYSTGAVSFLPLLDTVTRTIGQNGRRGASLAAIQDWHPDLLSFIKSKAYPEEVFSRDSITGELPTISYTNISVKLSDKFMKAVENDEDWILEFPDTNEPLYMTWDGNLDKWKNNGYKTIVYAKLKAKDILQLIAECSHKSGDPGILFWDLHKKYSTVEFDEDTQIENVNPCGEMPLHRNANCNLGTLVLYKYVKNPYTDKAEFDFELFKNDCKLAVEIMDCLLDESINKHPLLEQREQANYERRIGIGITGLADCLAMMNLKYDSSKETLNFIEEVMKTKCKVEWSQSLELAIQKGCAPAFKDLVNRDKFLKQLKIKEYLEFLEDGFEYKFIERGVRNIAISTVQPSGTLSIIANNCTSGIEPLFAIKYKRKTRIADNEEIDIIHPVLLEYLYNNNLLDDLKLSSKELCEKYNYIEASNVSYEDKLKIQSVIQKYVDTAISSTVNLPNSATVEDIYNLYVEAYNNKLKGITVFRDGCKTGVLENSEKSDENIENRVLTKDMYENIRKQCEQNNYNAETTLAFIEEYLKVGKTFNKCDEVSKDKNLGLYEIELLDEEDAVRHRMKWKNNIKVYINVTIDRDENKPLETFVSLPYEAGLDERGEFSSVLYLERKSDWDAINRLISVLLRYNIPLTEIIEQLQKSSYSMFTLSALMKRVLSKYLVTAEETAEDEEWEETVADGLDAEDEENDEPKILPTKNGYNICPECKNKSLIFEAGCWKCLNCFYSKCE